MSTLLLVLIAITQDQKGGFGLEKIGTSHGHSDITAVALSGNGKLAASSDTKGMVRVWSTDGELKETAEFRAALGEGVEQRVNDLVFSPDGKLLAAACDDKTIWMWDIQTKKLFRRQRGHEDRVKQILFTPDGKKAISVDDHYNCLTWNVAKDQVPVRYNFNADRISLSPDGKRMSVTDGNRTFIAETSSGRITQIIGSYSHLMCFTSDGKHVIKGSEGSQIEAWDVQNGRRIWSAKNLGNRSTVLFTTPDRKRVNAVDSNAFRTWNAVNGDLLGKYELQSSYSLTEAAFSVDGKLLLVGDRQGELGLYSLSFPK